MNCNDVVPNNKLTKENNLLLGQDQWELLRKRIFSKAVRFADNVVFDFRLLLTNAESAAMAGRLMWAQIKQFEPQVLVGPGFGAAPLLYAIALAALSDGISLNILMVRDKRKGHNQKKWVEGSRQPPGSRAIIIDDFMESGSALALVEKALLADGHQLDIRAFGLFFDMWQPLGSRQISTARFPVVSLYTRHDIGLSRDCFDAKPPMMTGSYPPFISSKPHWWRFSLNERTSYPLKCTPLIADNAVFVADDRSRVWRHNAYTGDIEWCYDSLAQPIKGIVQKLEFADGSLVFACYDGTLTRLDARTGLIIWRWRLDSSIHATPSLDLAHSRLFINTEQWNDGRPFGHLYALDWKTGRVLWKHVHAWWPPGSPVYDTLSNQVIATCNDQTVSAFNADTGVRHWTRVTPGLVRGKPAVAGTNVLIATEKGRLLCLDSNTGETNWDQRYGRNEMHQFLHIQADTVIVLDGRWHLVAFDLETGAIRWMSRLRSAGNWCPSVCGDYLVVLSRQGHLAVFDPKLERKVWEGAIPGHYRQPGCIGYIKGKAGDTQLAFAAASNRDGLRLYIVDSYYRSSTRTDLQRCEVEGHSQLVQLNSFENTLNWQDKITASLLDLNLNTSREPAVFKSRREAIKCASRSKRVIDSIPRIGSLDRCEFEKHAKNGLPFIVTGMIGHWPLTAMTPEILKERFSYLKGNARIGNYVANAFSAQREMCEQTLEDFINESQISNDVLPAYFGNQTFPELNALCQWPDFCNQYREPKIWFGPANTVTPLHCDYDDNVFAQVWGSKRFILYPPHHAEFLYIKESNPALFASKFDPENPDYEAMPLAQYAQKINCVVEAGELLFLPAGWFHHVRALSFSLSINRWTYELPMALQK